MKRLNIVLILSLAIFATATFATSSSTNNYNVTLIDNSDYSGQLLQYMVNGFRSIPPDNITTLYENQSASFPAQRGQSYFLVYKFSNSSKEIGDCLLVLKADGTVEHTTGCSGAYTFKSTIVDNNVTFTMQDKK